MIGIVFLILAGIMLFISLKAPRIYEGSSFTYNTSVKTTALQTTVKYPLNINTATAEELATIDGMSKRNAAAIVAYREEVGTYSDVSEIMNIKGIGETTYYKVAPYLEV